LFWPGWCNKYDLAIGLLDLEKHSKKKAEWRKGVGEHSVPRERHGVSDKIFSLSSREKWYIQGQSLFIFTLGYSQGGTTSERRVLNV
jgi:hypothetical protein